MSLTSHEQRRYWLMHESDGSGATFTTALYFRLRGPLDRPAMQAAFDDVVALHAVLRTRYEMSDELVAVVEASARCPLEYCDIGPVAAPMREIAFSAWLLDRANYRFDLRQAPLIRASLARAAPDDHGLVVCVHHIASDGWSSGRLVRDVLACYDARVAGRPPSLVPPAATYVDYAAHQARAASGRRHARALQFWCNRLAGAPSALPLPSDRSPDRPVGFAGAQLLTIIGPEQTAAVHQLARDHGATPYMVLLAALHVTMWLCTGARDQVIGSVMANRAKPAFHDVVGCCLDFLPIRVELAGTDTGATIVERVRLCVIDALRNRECSINEMAAALAPRTGRAKSPFYNVALIVEFPRTGADSHALEVSDLPVEERFAELDLRVISRIADDELRIVWEYSTELFTESTIRALGSAYAEIVDQLAAAPDQRIDQLSLPAALAARVDETRLRADANADVVVASTFPVELAADALDAWLAALGVDAHVRVAPPDRIFEELAGSAKPRWRIICVRTADERSGTELAAAIRESAARTGVRHLVCLCAASGVTGAASFERDLVDALGGAPNVRTLRTGELAPAALGAEIARQISLETRPVTKVIVVDGDDTLWTGVCAEIGPNAVVVDAGRRALQHALLAQRSEGVLLCLVSNNDPTDITRVLTETSEMVLRREHFAHIVASWDAKPARLYALSAALGVDLESFVVLDDDPLACAAIRAAAPEIVTYEVPRSEDIPAWLARVWAFDHMPVTADGRARADRQIDDVRRSALLVEHTRYADFLADLALEVTIAPIEPGDLPRVLELVRRTTQLTNGLPGAPFGLGESLPAGVVARVRDRFGDYGLVGAMLWSLDDGVARVSALAVSCRALGRGVEHALIAALGRCVARTAVPRIVIAFVATARNVPAQRFLDEVCGSIRGEAYELATETAVALRFVPSEPAPSGPERPDRPVGARAVTARALERAARGLVPAQRGPVSGSPGPRRLPTTEVERELFAMWRRLLRLGGMSIDDDFFDLGGTSLLATRMLAEIAERYGWRRPLGALFSQTTIATLADEIERGGEPVPQAAPATPSAERLAQLISALRVRPTLHIAAPTRSSPAARSGLADAGSASARDYVAPTTRTEQALVAIWRQVLGVDRVGIDDNFFQRGGHSLLAMRLVAQIRSEFGVELAPRDVFERPTIATQAKQLDELARSGAGSDIAAERWLAERVRAWSDDEVASQLESWATVSLELAPVAESAGMSRPRSELLARLVAQHAIDAHVSRPLARRSSVTAEATFTQSRMWDLHELGDTVANTNPQAFAIRGPLDVEAMGEAFAALVARQRALRTTFALVGDRLIQTASDSWAGFDIVDVSARDQRERSALPRAQFDAIGRPLDLRRESFRARLVRCGEREHVLLVAAHHIVLDGMSSGAMWSELTELYRAAAAGDAANLPALELEFTDFCFWQTTLVDRPVGRSQLEFWANAVAGYDPLELPGDLAATRRAPGSALEVYPRRGTRFVIEGEAWDAVQRLCARLSVLPYTVIATALFVFLTRTSGRRDACVMSGSHHRYRPGTEPVIGNFVTPYPLRIALDPAWTLERAIWHCDGEVLAYREHQGVAPITTFPAWSEVTRYNLNYMVASAPAALQLGSASVERLDWYPQRETINDLALIVRQSASGVDGNLTYNATRFSDALATRIAARLRDLIHTIATEPTLRLDAIAVSSD